MIMQMIVEHCVINLINKKVHELETGVSCGSDL